MGFYNISEAMLISRKYTLLKQSSVRLKIEEFVEKVNFGSALKFNCCVFEMCIFSFMKSNVYVLKIELVISKLIEGDMEFRHINMILKVEYF